MFVRVDVIKIFPSVPGRAMTAVRVRLFGRLGEALRVTMEVTIALGMASHGNIATQSRESPLWRWRVHRLTALLNVPGIYDAERPTMRATSTVE